MEDQEVFMPRTPHVILPAALVLIGITPALAQTQGRITGKVTSKADGKPIANAKVTLKRTDRNWVKVLVTDAKGTFAQAGLEPVNYEMTVAAEGFAGFGENIKIPIGESLQKDVQLSAGASAAPTQNLAQMPASAAGAQEENEGIALFEQAKPFYNEKKFVEALPLLQGAHEKLTLSYSKTTDESAKATLQTTLDIVGRAYGICLFEAGKKAESKPFLEKAYARNEAEAKLDKSKWDLRVVDLLAQVAKDAKDVDGQKKYQDILDEAAGPRPENAYNDGVTAFNANKMKEAKGFFLKAIQIKPDFPDSHYMLGLVEINAGNVGAAKQHFKKYIELAPTGKYAGEAREMVKAL